MRNYVVEGHSQSSFVATRFFFLGFGPVYVEPAVGLVHWNGAVKPRGNDEVTDIAASSLNSRFDLIGVDINASLGLMWIFNNGIFLDYNLMSLSEAFLIQESYSVSTHETRQAIRSQIAGPMTMSNLNLRVGYALDF
jgi:hypothetical protein